jgi:hypothetical protein
MSDDEISDDEGRFLDAHSDECVPNESHPNVTINENTTTTISALMESSNLAESSTVSNGDSIKLKITGTSSTIKRKTKTSPVWTYFQHFNINYHPDMKHFRVCLVFRANGVEKPFQWVPVPVLDRWYPIYEHIIKSIKNTWRKNQERRNFCN